MFFSSINDEKAVDISEVHHKLSVINGRLQKRDQWFRFVQTLIKNNRIRIFTKLLQYDRPFIACKRKKLKIIFNRWKFRKRWFDFYHKLKTKQIYILKERFKGTKKDFSNQNRRNIWKKLAKKLRRRNQFTYLISDFSLLVNYRIIKRCFEFWIDRFSTSPSFLRKKWKYLMSKSIHREIILRIYNVQNENHTRIIWRDFVDKIIHQYYLNQIHISNINALQIRRQWIFLSRNYVHKTIMDRLYRVKSKLKTRVVWKYFISSSLKRFKKIFFEKCHQKYQLNKNRTILIRNNWERLFKSFLIYSHKINIQSASKYYKLFSYWKSFTKRLCLMRISSNLSKESANYFEREKKKRQIILLKRSFKLWFAFTVSSKQLLTIYGRALSALAPDIQHTSAAMIQRMFRLHLRHQKRFNDMIFNNLPFDQFVKSMFCNSFNHFYNLTPSAHKNQNHLLKEKNNTVEKNAIKHIRMNYELSINKITLPHIYFNYVNTNDIIKQNLDRETTFDFDDVSESWLNFDDLFHSKRCLFYFTKISKKKRNSMFRMLNQTISKISNIFSFRIDQQFDEYLIYIKSSLVSIGNYHPIQSSQRDKLGHIFDDNDQFYLPIDDFNDFEINTSPLESLNIMKGRESVFQNSKFTDIISDGDNMIELNIPSIKIPFSLPNYCYRPGYIETVFNKNTILIELDFNNIFNNFSILPLFNFKLPGTQCIDIEKQQNNQVRSLSFGFDDRVFLKNQRTSKLKSQKYALFQTRTDILFNEKYFINGFNFIPTISSFAPINKFIENESFNEISDSNFEFIAHNSFYNLFPFFAVAPIINKKVRKSHEFLLKKFKYNLLMDNFQIDLGQNLKYLFSFIPKRKSKGTTSFQDNLLNSYIDSFEESTYEIGVDNFSFDLGLSNLTNVSSISIEKRPSEMIENTVSHTIDDSIISLNDLPIEIPKIKYSRKDDKSFIDSRQLNNLTTKIMMEIMNEMPIISNIPTSETIFEIANGFLISVALTPPRLIQGVQKLEQFQPKDPISLTDDDRIEFIINSIFNGISFPLVPNNVGKDFSVDIDLSFNDLLNDITSQIDIESLEILESKDDKVIASKEVIENLMNLIEKLILNNLPLIPNLPSNAVLDEISNDYSFYQDTIGAFASFGLRNQFLLNYTIKDDKAFIDDKFIDQFTLKVLLENQLPIIPNVPDDNDIRLIAEDFYSFCYLNKKIPLSPIKKIEMKDSQFLNPNHKIVNQPIDLPIISNSPNNDNTICEINSSLFYDASDIICYITGFESIIPLVLFEMKDDMFFSSYLFSDKICNDIILNEIKFPIIPNLVNENTIIEIINPLIKNIDVYCYEFLFSTNKTFKINLDYQTKDDRAFIDIHIIDQVMDNCFNSIFEQNLIFRREPDGEMLNSLVSNFNIDFVPFSIFDTNPLYNIETKDMIYYVSQWHVDNIIFNILDSIFLEEHIICPNIAKEETIIEVIDDVFDSEVDSLSTFKVSSLSNYQIKDDRFYADMKTIDNIALNILDSIFYKQKILCPNVVDEETAIKIADSLADTSVDQFSFLDYNSLLRFQLKDDLAFIDQDFLNSFTSEFVFNELDMIPIEPNIPNSHCIFEIINTNEIHQIFSDYNDFSNFNKVLDPILNFEQKNDKYYCDWAKVFEIINNLIPQNIPIVLNNLDGIDPFKFLEFIKFDQLINQVVSNEFNIHEIHIDKNDDRAFIINEVIESLYDNMLLETIDNGPLEMNIPSKKDVEEIAILEIENMINVYDFFQEDNLLLPLSRYEKKDSMFFFSNDEADTIFYNILQTIQFPIIKNDINETDILITEDFYDLTVRNSLFYLPLYQLPFYTMKDDKAFIDTNFIDYFIDIELSKLEYPIAPNLPSKSVCNELASDFLYVNDSISYKSIINSSYSYKNSLQNYEPKDPKSLINFKSIEKFALSLITDLPIIENSFDSTIYSEMINFIVLKNNVFNLNFNTYENVKYLNLISPNERRIHIDNDIVENIASTEFSLILKQKLPIVSNSVTQNELNKIVSFIDNQLQFSNDEINFDLSPLINLNPSNKKIKIDEKVPKNIISFIDLYSSFQLLPKKSIEPIANYARDDKLIFLNDDFYDSIMLKILYKDVLPIIPIRKSLNQLNIEDNSKTETFLEDEDYNDVSVSTF